MPAPPTPIGLHLARVARTVSRAFDQALAEAGGSRPMWLVLLNLKINPTANQRELAEAVGIGEATLTHHLSALESDGLLTRRRGERNRRIHVLELTDAGKAAFVRLRDAALAFDTRLRAGLNPNEIETAARVLQRLADNVGPAEDPTPRAGLIERTP
ncbi:MAG TPA: MarR family winged helix-turn-helix transcriptional regulator [Solirubrobacteraceae bacterium]|jgi:MarR family transcriptional regulator for hemolysin|nr:MarR family winged helix-turn-helix transcriptional regulator [Solirubrobacteraceae bacterium]